MENRRQPAISVLIPIYNDRLYLADALKSIQRQQFTDWECICINDGSTDDSEAIIDRFVQEDKRFLKLNKENGGVSSARNAGLQRAQGEYIFFMDHDDLIPDYTLGTLWEAAEKYDADFSRGRKQMIAEDFRLEELPKAETQSIEAHCFDTDLYKFPRYTRGKYRIWCSIWLCLFKRESIRGLQFAEALRAGGEDNLFMYEVLTHIKKFVQIDAITLCHRYSKTSVTLNGYNPALMKTVEVRIPYIYEHFAKIVSLDKQFLRWIYRSEAHDAYRLLIKKPLRANRQEVYALSTGILNKLINTEAFDETQKYWHWRQKFVYRLFVNGRFGLLQYLTFWDIGYHRLFKS